MSAERLDCVATKKIHVTDTILCVLVIDSRIFFSLDSGSFTHGMGIDRCCVGTARALMPSQPGFEGGHSLRGAFDLFLCVFLGISLLS